MDKLPTDENTSEITSKTFECVKSRTNRNWMNDLEARKILRTLGIETI